MARVDFAVDLVDLCRSVSINLTLDGVAVRDPDPVGTAQLEFGLGVYAHLPAPYLLRPRGLVLHPFRPLRPVPSGPARPARASEPDQGI